MRHTLPLWLTKALARCGGHVYADKASGRVRVWSADPEVQRWVVRVTEQHREWVPQIVRAVQSAGGRIDVAPCDLEASFPL